MEKMRPRIFIGSSTEAKLLASALKAALATYFDARLWAEDIFEPSDVTMDALLRAADTSDFALLIFSPDDIVLMRDSLMSAVRDNVLFELGLFAGRLGRKRSLFMLPKTSANLRIASDLGGITGIV